METLLIVAVVVITLAVVAQAGILIAMYLMSRRISGKAESLMHESRQLMAPVESITSNLKTASDELTQTARITREQALHIQSIVNETHASVRQDIESVRERVLGKVEEAGDVFMRPLRQYSALAIGISEGIRTFFFGRKRTRTEEEHPAA